MNKIILTVIITLLVIYCLVYTYMLVMTHKNESSDSQTRFSAGTMPNPLPSGKYKGMVKNYTGVWKGKSFDAALHTGNNQFGDSDKYPFNTSEQNGLRDSSLKVLRIDYNRSENPLYLRFLRDEIVQTSPGHYQGKIMVQWIFGSVFTIGYFQLEQ